MTSEYTTSYLIPPSVELAASACDSCGPGLSGSLIGNAVTGTAGLAVAVAVAVALAVAVAVAVAVGVAPAAFPASVGVVFVLGVWSATMTTEGSFSSVPLTTKIAGCSLVGPPCGIIATARWRPGVSFTGGTWAACGRAACRGWPTVCTAETSVPRSVARTGWY